MGEKEEQYSLRELVRQHMNDSNDRTTKILTELAAIKTHGTYTKSTLEKHDKTIDELKSAHNKQKGALWILSLIGLGGLEELVRNALK